LWWVAYTLRVFLFSQYYVVFMACAIVCVFAGSDAIVKATSGRLRRAADAAQVILPVVISVMVMPQFKRDVQDRWLSNSTEIALEAAIQRLGGQQAIVIVRYSASVSPEEEVVFNFDVAWPDDARVIRAHDLGDDRNRELYRYYAQRQPRRIVYRFDRADGSMRRLGLVTHLAGGMDEVPR
jgi:hypothetical protein